MNLKTRIRSSFMRHASSLSYQHKIRNKARKRRTKQGLAPVVHYFHQVDDPYSHLAVQKLDQLREHYALTFQPHLVAGPEAAFQGSQTHFAQWASRDVANVASAYGTTFPAPVGSSSATPNAAQVAQANELLSHHLDQTNFGSIAKQIGEALWLQQPLEPQTNRSAKPQTGTQAIQTGNALRQKLGHYQGAMFYFDGEWFWGIDRLRLLEARLQEEGYAALGASICVPEPTPINTNLLNASDVLVEYFPSLRSPYTAIGHQRVVDLMARSGVTLKVRPVMPMLMRGIPAPRAKQRYIITDSGREGRAHGAPLGQIVDPFGEPVKQAFTLFPGTEALGKPMEFITAYLTGAWFDGIDITTTRGLRKVVSNAGLDWQALQQATQETNWEVTLDNNLNDLLSENLWGVPSFRVSGGNSEHPFACWGQDRIWRVENEIAARSQNQ